MKNTTENNWEKELQKTMLYTMAGSWLECSEYEATIKENRDFISSLLSSHDQQLRQRIVEEAEKIIQKERFAGAPAALNKLITFITNLK